MLTKLYYLVQVFIKKSVNSHIKEYYREKIEKKVRGKKEERKYRTTCICRKDNLVF
jgi:hypothetical protein